MKNVTVHDQLMKKVIAFEKQRSYLWVVLFILGIGAIATSLGIALWAFGTEVVRRQTLDLLGLFREDWEIIRDYWQDTMGIFLEELPQEWLIIALIALVGLIGTVWASSASRRRVARRIRDLASYSKIRNNTLIKKNL